MNMKQFELIKKFLKECEEKTFNLKNSKTVVFDNPITFLKIENYLQENLDEDEFEQIGINYGNLDSSYFVNELNFKLTPIIQFEYQSMGPVSFFQGINILSCDESYHYLIRSTEDEDEIFIKQNPNDFNLEISEILKIYFKNSEFYNLEKTMGSVPTFIDVNPKYRKNLNPEIMKECVSLYLDSFTDDNKYEKWILELEYLNLMFETENPYERSKKILKKFKNLIEENMNSDISEKKIISEVEEFKEILLKLIIYHKLRYL